MSPPSFVVVIDPRVLVMAVVLPGSDAAKLLALLAFGKVSTFARDGTSDESTASMPNGARQRGRAVEDVRKDADRRAGEIRSLLPSDAPDDLVLATSLHLTRELVRSAQHLQTLASHLRPDAVVRQVNAHAWLVAEVRRPPPDDDRAGHSYLLKTALAAGAGALVTSDESVLKAASAESFLARPLESFVEERLLSRFDFGAIDALPVIQAAVAPFPRDETGA